MQKTCKNCGSCFNIYNSKIDFEVNDSETKHICENCWEFERVVKNKEIGPSFVAFLTKEGLV